MQEFDPHFSLLRLVAKGNQDAFEKLYDLTSGVLFSVAVKLLSRKELAEEAVQEAYVQIWHGAGEYQPGRGKVLTWMVSILRYRSLDMIRYQNVRKESALDNLDIAVDGDGTDYLGMDDESLLNKCLHELNSDQRQAIGLAYFHGLTHGEVTTHMEKPIGTIKAWIRRGLQSLQRCLTA